MNIKKLVVPATAMALALLAVSGAAAAMPNAEYYSHSGTITVSAGASIADAISAPDDGKFVQMAPGSEIVMRFPDHGAAVPDGTGAADLRVDIFDAIFEALAEVHVSLDGAAWTSLGLYADTANIDLDLEVNGPVKWVKIVQNELCDPGVAASGFCIDQAFPTLGFDLDAVVALTPGTLPYGEITSPGVDEVVFGSADFGAVYYDDDPGAVDWAVRFETCAAATNTVFGNVDTFSDPFTWDGHLFQATADVSAWTPGRYCFVFNPREEAGEQNARLARWFWVGSLGALSPAIDYNPVESDHSVSVGIGVPVAGVEVFFEVSGANATSGSALTDGSGAATFTYAGASPGTDSITACIDSDASTTCDALEPTATADATKYWLEHYVTGGGQLVEGRGKGAAKISSSGNVGFDLAGNVIGQWQINFHNVNNDDLDRGHFHTTSFQSLVFTNAGCTAEPDPPDADYVAAVFTAHGRFNGEDGWAIWVSLADYGEPGAGLDSARIRLYRLPTNFAAANIEYDSWNQDTWGGGSQFGYTGDFPDDDLPSLCGPGVTQSVRTKLDHGNYQIHPPALP
jgi:hypothetical protein